VVSGDTVNYKSSVILSLRGTLSRQHDARNNESFTWEKVLRKLRMTDDLLTLWV